ncbi:hypothetical protein [Rarobacter faecitabidus]|uniref:hypothetical protein n=1 Tax=Rarobacter faecitabidus TaxID=13243 RepID=UPI0031DF0306
MNEQKMPKSPENYPKWALGALIVGIVMLFVFPPIGGIALFCALIWGVISLVRVLRIHRWAQRRAQGS